MTAPRPTIGDLKIEAKVEDMIRASRVSWWSSPERHRFVLGQLVEAGKYVEAAITGEINLTDAVFGALHELRRAELDLLEAELPWRVS